MYNHTYTYNVNPQNRRFCSDTQGTPITDLPRFYFGERPVFTMTFPDNVLTEGEKLVFVMDNENRFLDSHSITGLEPVMAWCVHEITAEDVQNKSIDLELYCFGRKYADVINGHDNAVTCILSLFIKSIDENLNCTFSTLATTLAYAEPTIVSPDCVFDELPIDMYLTRDEMNALIAEVEAIQREAIAKAEQARQSASVAEAFAQEASQIAKDLKPLQLSSPPTTSTVGSVGQLAVWHDSDNGKDHLYHLCFVSEGESATLYHWEECVLVSQGNVAGGYAALDENGKVASEQIPLASASKLGGIMYESSFGLSSQANGKVYVYAASQGRIDGRTNQYNPITSTNLDYAVRSVLPNVTEIPAATSDYSLVDSSATTNNHSHVYSHAPTTAPTYRLPQVTDTTISHYIELTVDFTAVQTYSFLDYQGESIVPLFTPAIAAGDVYTFKMEYSAIKGAWLIYPQKQGAVADDYVMRGEVGAANGVAGLDANAKVPQGQLTVAGTIIDSTDQFGCIKVGSSQGFRVFSGYLNLRTPTDAAIAARSGASTGFGAITTNNLNKAVTAAITDANHITLTDEQKATAQEVFGVPAPLLGTTAPTTSTVGVIGQLYVNTATSKTYHCTKITVDDTDPNNVVTTYTWTDDVNTNGGLFIQGIAIGRIVQNDVTNNSLIIGYGLKATNTCKNSIVVGGWTDKPSCTYSALIGNALQATNNLTNVLITGVYNISKNCARIVGNGTSSARKNIEELSWNGDLYIAGGHQQGITVIPAATTSYTLAEGNQSHTPEAASVYTLPAVTDATRTHECILTIKFSSTVLTYEFQDSAGNTLVPLPLNGDIEAGSVVTFLCRYNLLLAQWVIYPVMDGKEAE